MKFLSIIICLFVLNTYLSEAKVSKFFKIGAAKFKKIHLHKSKKQYEHVTIAQHAVQTPIAQAEYVQPIVPVNEPLIGSPLLTLQVRNHQSLLQTVSSYLNENVEETEVAPAYQWQINIHTIQPTKYQTLVNRIILTRPMSSWPIIVRELVFPQIYGFFPQNRLLSSLKKLYNHELKSSDLLSEDFDVSQQSPIELNEADLRQLDLLDRLSKLEVLKRQVDKNLIKQTQQLLEGRDYEKKVEKLLSKVQEQPNMGGAQEVLTEQVYHGRK